MSVRLDSKAVGRHIARQLLRSATSCGASYEEAAESKADFVHQMQIVLKEVRESLYWLKLVKKVAALSDDGVQPLIGEANELANIFAQSIITAKGPTK